MFVSKKKKIRKYLISKSDCDKCAFDFLLSDFLDGALKEKLTLMGIVKTEIHIDWLEDIKCIGIQGKYEKYYMDLQIYPKEFSISFDIDEPDEDITYPLESKEQLYNVILDVVKILK